MNCQNCGKELQGRRVCRHCGMAQLQPAAEPVAPAAIPSEEQTPPAEKKDDAAAPPAADAAAVEKPEAKERQNAPVPPEEKPLNKLERARQRLAQQAHVAAEQRAQQAQAQKEAPPAPDPPPPPESEPRSADPPSATEPSPAPAASAPPPPKKEEPPRREPRSEPAAASPPEPERPPEQPHHARNRIPIAARISKSKLRDYNAIHGDHNNIIYNILDKAGFAGNRDEVEAEEPSIFDYLMPLPELRMNDCGATAFLEADLRAKTAALKRDRLLVISCGNESFLRSAGAAVAETLGIPVAQRKLLSSMWSGVHGYAPTIDRFRFPRPDPETESVIVVDAGEGSRQLLDSLLAIEGAWTYDEIRLSLREQHLSLICLVDSVRFDKLSTEDRKRLRFDWWKVSYLQYLLRQHFPDDFARMEAVLEEQRKRGRWAAAEAEFHEQVREYVDKRQIEQVIEAGGISVSAVPECFPKPNQPVHLTATYAAAFFSNLSPVDFGRVMTLLLGSRTQTIKVKERRKGKDGADEEVEIEREKPLIDIWREDADAILTECNIVTSKGTSRAIAFAAAGSRERIRTHLESSFGLYVQSHFQTIMEKDLLFDTSNRLADGVRSLVVDMVLGDRDQYSDTWLYELIASSIQRCSEKDGPLRMRRIAKLLEELWSAEEKSLVEAVLRSLIDTGLHEVVFAILQILRPTAGLNELEYVRQILERGNESMRQRVYSYLSRELRLPRKGAAIDTLRALDSWLPPIDRDPDRYSRANTLALKLMLEYCVDATTEYGLADYGKWPTDFALLDATTAEKAKDDFTVLARWLLNPGLRCVLDTSASAERTNRLISALVAEWAFILLGQSPKSAADTAMPFSADAALAVLLQQLIAQAEASHQRALLHEMVEYWEGLKDILLSIANDPDEETARNEVLWKRQVVRKLLGHFRDLQRIRKTAPSAHAATA